MGTERPVRLTFEDSCRFLQRRGHLDEGNPPPLPPRPPRHDDRHPLGVSFFRTVLADDDLENLTLPRTFIGRTEVGPISFENTDFSESTFCWNDFNEVDFTDADLSGCDLRASVFRGVVFVRSLLRNADLRGSEFEDCDFHDADMRGARLTEDQGEDLELSYEQRAEIDWQTEGGEEPGGG